MIKDLRSKNDNLQEWREEKRRVTEKLLRKAIHELSILKGKVNAKNVCEMMKRIATQVELEYKADISPSAISKNEVFKNIILEANIKSEHDENKRVNNATVSEKKLENHKLKTIIAKQDVKIKELESIIKRANVSSQCDIKNEYIDYSNIIKELISFILKEGVGYKDNQSNLLKEFDNNVLVSSLIMKKIFNNEI